MSLNIKKIANQIIKKLGEEFKDEKVQENLKENVIHPIIKIIFKEISPYVMTLLVIISLTFFFGLFTCIILVLSHLKRYDK